MTKREAKRRVCAAASVILDSGEINELLFQGSGGKELSDPDIHRMRFALIDLIWELQRRGGE